MKTLEEVDLPAPGEHSVSFFARESVWHIIAKPHTWIVSEEKRLAGMMVKKPDGYEVRGEDEVFDTYPDWREATRFIIANL